MAKYDYPNYNTLNDLADSLPESSWDSFKAIIQKDQLMRQALWLHPSGFPKEVQTTVEDLPFEGVKLLTEKNNTPLHS